MKGIATPAQLSLLDETGTADSFVVREHGRARRMSIKVLPYGRVEVIVPRRSRAPEIQAFVRRNRHWIDHHRRELERQFPRAGLQLPEHIELAAIRRRWNVRYHDGETGRSRIRSTTDTLEIHHDPADEEPVRAALRRWLAAQGRAYLVPWCAELSAQTGLRYERIQIRGQRTRWGSCSARGTLSLNYCLLFLAPELVRYLLVHELCHTRHLNHSKRFWSLVAGHEPRWRELDRELGQAWREVPGWLGLR